MSRVPDARTAWNYANGPRQPVRAFVRRVRKALVVRVIALAHRGLRADDVELLRVDPVPRTDAERADLSARLNWYLPQPSVPLVVDESLDAPPDAAPHMAPDLVHAHPAHIRTAVGRDHVLLCEVSLRALARRGRRLGATTIVDPMYYRNTDSGGYGALVERFSYPESAGDGLARLLARSVSGGSAIVIGTGPSAETLDVAALEHDFRITCNSAVRNIKWLVALRPTVIAAGDPIYQFGPSRYAAQFREDLLRAIDATDAVVALPAYGAGLLIAHHPDVADRLVVVDGDAPAWRWPSTDAPQVRRTDNTLTRFMLPLAFALADHVDIAGCDGRKPDETFFWRHSKAIQYDDALMNTLAIAHPAWFRDRDYKRYYDRHAADLEEFLSLAETKGKTVRSSTPSYIPALARRGGSA